MRCIFMNEYVIDSSAWIDYFLANQDGEKVKKIVESEDNQCVTPSLCVAEITIKLKKFDLDYKSAFDTIKRLSIIPPLDEALAFDAGLIHVEKRKKYSDIGIVDVVIQTYAKSKNMRIVTRDIKHFKDEKNVVLI
jgi:predicted nucleic acid-binding protein